MGIFQFVLSMIMTKMMEPDQTNNTTQYDSEAADARRNAERRELKNKRNRAGLDQTVGAGLNGVNDILG